MLVVFLVVDVFLAVAARARAAAGRLAIVVRRAVAALAVVFGFEAFGFAVFVAGRAARAGLAFVVRFGFLATAFFAEVAIIYPPRYKFWCLRRNATQSIDAGPRYDGYARKAPVSLDIFGATTSARRPAHL